MSTNWYRYKDNDVVGPFTELDLLEMVKSGDLQPSDLVCRANTTAWVRADSVKLSVSAEAKSVSASEVAGGEQVVEVGGVAGGEVQQDRALVGGENEDAVGGVFSGERLRAWLPAAAVFVVMMLMGVGVIASFVERDDTGGQDGFQQAGDEGNGETVEDQAKTGESVEVSLKKDQDLKEQLKIDFTKVSYEKDIVPLLEAYCVKCHGNEKQKSDLNMKTFKKELDVLKHGDTWEDIFDQVLYEDMPPEDEKQPSVRERAMLTGWIEHTLSKVDCEGPINPGRVTYRRLNRVEYNNTIRDLMMVDFQPADDFPSDDVGYGFDNIGDVLSLPPLLMEKYLDAAEVITRRAIATETDVKAENRHYPAERMKLEGGGREQGVFVHFHSIGSVWRNVDIEKAGRYVIRVKAYGERGGKELPRFVVKIDNKEVKQVEVPALRNRPVNYDVPVRLEVGRRKIEVGFANDFYDDKYPEPELRDRNLAIDWVEVIGPYFSEEDLPKFHRAHLQVEAKEGESEIELARRVLRPIMNRAWRRPVSEDEVKRVSSFVKMALDQGDSYEHGLRLAMQAVLVSPHFLFRIEPDRKPDKADDPFKSYTLNEWELATRLSYFLWSTMPDETLMKLAGEGKLREQLDAQVKRMLEDSKSAAFIENFGGQWLTLRNLEAMDMNPEQFAMFDDKLKQSMMKETLLFFEHVMRENKSVLEFVNADYTFMDERLAKLYGREDVKGDSFRKVTYRAEDKRRGVLTHASILTLTSNPTRTSPVKRGKWVMEQILGTPPPEAPEGVPALEEQDAADPKMSLREQFALHRADPGCASCHIEMDAIGFAFEHYNAIGQWREKEGRHPINAAGELPDGSKFKDSLGLISVIEESRKDLFVNNLARMMMTYGIGRGLDYYDKCEIQKIADIMNKNDNRFHVLVSAVVKSDAFQKRSGLIME